MPADVTGDTKAMIDYLVHRYKMNQTEDRAKLLDLLQTAEEDIWSLGDWWFRQFEETLQVAVGTAVYTVNEPCNNVIRLSNASGRPLDYVEPDTYARIFGEHTATVGTPTLWTQLPKETQATCKIQMYPAPSVVQDMVLVTEKKSATLEDSDGSQSNLPQNYRTILLDMAEVRLMEMEGQANSAAQKQARVAERIEALRAEDRRQPKVVR